ncbi:Zinc finger FYVE domain-containing protein 1, partial [Nibea albiflora]
MRALIFIHGDVCMMLQSLNEGTGFGFRCRAAHFTDFKVPWIQKRHLLSLTALEKKKKTLKKNSMGSMEGSATAQKGLVKIDNGTKRDKRSKLRLVILLSNRNSRALSMSITKTGLSQVDTEHRVRIAPGHVPFCDSCKGDSSCSVSGGRLRAVVRCQGCKIKDCQKRTHSGANKRKYPLTPYPPAKAPQDNSVNAGESQIEILKAELEKVCSFLLVDEKEEMQVKDEDDFVSRLGCKPDELLKVLSIFGNTGEVPHP